MRKTLAHDGVDGLGEGRHQLYVVARDKFNARLAAKTRHVTSSG